MSSSSSASLPLIKPSLVVGPVEAGILANAFLTGAFFVQVYIYFTRFSEDRWTYKAVALVLMALQLSHFLTECAVLWDMTVVALDSPLVLLTMTTAMIAVTLITTLVAFVVQLFFIYRLWKISEKSWLPTVFALCLTCLRQVPSYFNVARAYDIPDALAYWPRTRTTTILAFAAAVISDIWVSTIISYYLWIKRRSGSFATTSHLLDRLILWTIETGLFTCLTSTLILILYLVQPNNYIWLSVFAILGSVYANALMAALNGRWIIQHRSQVEVYQVVANISARSTSDKSWENPSKGNVIDIHHGV